MKIIYLTSARIPDEWAHVTQIMKMCEAFTEAGNEVQLVVPWRAGTRSEDPFAQACVKPIFAMTRLPCIDLLPGKQGRLLFWLRTFSFLVMARLYLALQKYDLLYTRELFVLGAPSKTVFELHSMHSVQSALRILKKARGVVAITNGLKRDLVLAGVGDAHIIVAPDGVSLDDFANPESKTEARLRLGISSTEKVASYIGILDAWKGTETLYRAAKLLAPDVTVVVIGGFNGEERHLAVEHREVRFLGYRPYRELPGNQQAADVLVLPNSGREAISAKYTSPLKLFTYMASGVPIVASDLPSLREVLSEKNAFIVSPDDPEALALGIRQALENPDDAETRARQARLDVVDYTWENRAKRILSFIKIVNAGFLTRKQVR